VALAQVKIHNDLHGFPSSMGASVRRDAPLNVAAFGAPQK
jgi:hypothetical protein